MVTVFQQGKTSIHAVATREVNSKTLCTTFFLRKIGGEYFVFYKKMLSSIADGCENVFVDAGANIGMHARFLFEPFRYPKSRFRHLFEKIFGEGRNYTCAIEIEPNPMHKKRHKYLQYYYEKKKLRYIYLQNAVGNVNGWETFYLNPTIAGGVTHSH